MKDLNYHFDFNNPDLIETFDELPLWSAPFGIRLLDLVKYKSSINALDIGCGTGFPLLELAMRLGSTSKVYGIDPWEALFPRILKKMNFLGIENVVLEKGLAEKLPFEDEFFNLVVSNNGINNVENEEEALKQIYRTTAQDAQIILTMNLKESMHEFYTTFEEILKLNNCVQEIQDMHDHIYHKRKPVSYHSELIHKAGFRDIRIQYDTFTLKFTDGTSMLNHYFIRLAFLPSWLNILKKEDRESLFFQVSEKLNEISRKQGSLSLSIPFCIIEFYK